MAISLEDDRPELKPAVRLPEVGDSIIGALINLEQIDAIDPETKQVERKENGQPKKVLVLHIRVLDFTGSACVGSSHDNREPEPGEVARIFVQGGTWKWWIECRENHQVEVGDVIRWKFVDTTPNPNPRHSDFKNRKFEIRRAKPDESEMVAECEKLHRDMKSAPITLDSSEF